LDGDAREAGVHVGLLGIQLLPGIMGFNGGSQHSMNHSICHC